MEQTIKKMTEEIAEEIIKLRRHLHQHPELAFCESKTADFICNYLDECGVKYQKGVAKTGVVGLISADAAEKTLLIRADMDALPINEETGLKYASHTPGVMHACGHDGHMAVLLGAAKILSRLRHELSCNIKLVFQPGEEAAGGAEPMIEEGVLNNPTVDAALGFHIMNDTPSGQIKVKSGAMMACPDDYDLIIRGNGGHAAYPHECVDPIVMAAHVITAFQTLAARFTTPFEPKVISVCAVNGGNFYNVIPDSVHLKGTVRMFDKALRRQIPEQMEAVVKHVTEMFGGSYDFTYRFMYPPLINDAKITEMFARSAAKVVGVENVIWAQDPSMGGEDFSYFAGAVPATYFNIGSGNELLGSTMPLHSANYLIDEACLAIGVKAICQFAWEYGREE